LAPTFNQLAEKYNINLAKRFLTVAKVKVVECGYVQNAKCSAKLKHVKSE